MAEVAYRLRTIDQNQRVADMKVLRRDRKNNRGLYVNATTGFASRDRRNVINRALATGTNAPAPIVRERGRKGWSLTAALNTVQS